MRMNGLTNSLQYHFESLQCASVNFCSNHFGTVRLLASVHNRSLQLDSRGHVVVPEDTDSMEQTILALPLLDKDDEELDNAQLLEEGEESKTMGLVLSDIISKHANPLDNRITMLMRYTLVLALLTCPSSSVSSSPCMHVYILSYIHMCIRAYKDTYK